MKKIWKFQFNTNDTMNIKMPKGAEILSVQTQFDQPCIWALVDPDAQLVNRKFRIFGTGHPVSSNDNLEFIGTYQEQGGALVFHLFGVA